MYFVYSLLLTLGFLVLLPRFLIDALRHGKYVAGFGERMGKLPPLQSTGRPVVWLHCVSVGESQAARPLVAGIRRQFPDYSIVVSTTTLTGQKLAREIFKNEAARVFYFPFDWRWTVRRSLRAIRPSSVLIMETEIWPRFFRECQTQGIPLAIINGRLSSQSFRRYMWIQTFLKTVLPALTRAVMQTETDAGRIIELGLDQSRVAVSGNMKFDVGTTSGSSSLVDEFRERYNITGATQLLIAASTHAPEENVVLEALAKTNRSDLRLLIAPRHPERFDDVASLLDQSGLHWSRRSSPPRASDKFCDAILLDTIGELSNIYSLATIVFVGGSISSTGGHNILEPAVMGAAIITGPHMQNFAAISRAFVKAGAIIQLSSGNHRESANALAAAVNDLMNNDALRFELQAKAKQLVELNRGATERTLHYLEPILTGSTQPNS
ncbi:MAG: 3-deoxy-D-manno-octulosonic acid transferase [Pyrinomonadaceae bacterium]